MGDIIFLHFLAAVIVCLALFVYKYISGSKKRKQGTQDDMASRNAMIMVVLPHTAGLPIAEKTSCSLYYCDERIEIDANGVQFNLDFSKLHDIRIVTSTEIQNQLVSSAGGAVGGGMLFGAFGALIFGRVQKRQIKDVRSYLVFTYSTNSGVDYIAFELAGKNRYANMMINEFNSRPANKRTVDL